MLAVAVENPNYFVRKKNCTGREDRKGKERSDGDLEAPEGYCSTLDRRCRLGVGGADSRQAGCHTFVPFKRHTVSSFV